MRGEMSAIAEGAVAPRREIADDLAQNCQGQLALLIMASILVVFLSMVLHLL
jgi:hypothetical protein